jgi:hypothetical protein
MGLLADPDPFLLDDPQPLVQRLAVQDRQHARHDLEHPRSVLPRQPEHDHPTQDDLGLRQSCDLKTALTMISAHRLADFRTGARGVGTMAAKLGILWGSGQHLPPEKECPDWQPGGGERLGSNPLFLVLQCFIIMCNHINLWTTINSSRLEETRQHLPGRRSRPSSLCSTEPAAQFFNDLLDNTVRWRSLGEMFG